LAASIPEPDDTADDLIPLYPLHPPETCVNVVWIELDGSHNVYPSGRRELLRKGLDIGKVPAVQELLTFRRLTKAMLIVNALF
jgi:hypothetical protein